MESFFHSIFIYFLLFSSRQLNLLGMTVMIRIIASLMNYPFRIIADFSFLVWYHRSILTVIHFLYTLVSYFLFSLSSPSYCSISSSIVYSDFLFIRRFFRASIADEQIECFVHWFVQDCEHFYTSFSANYLTFCSK